MTGIQIDVTNPYKDTTQVDCSTGMGINNLSFEPTVQEFNQLIGSSDGTDVREDDVEPLFGTHIREAVTTLKKLL
jgi:hypothetical protein